MTVLYVLGSLSVALSIVTGYFAIKQNAKMRMITKLSASILFVFVGLLAIKYSGVANEYSVFVLAAMIFGMLGDIFLAMGGLDNPKSKTLLNAIGVLTFAIGHVFFIYIFLSSANLFAYWTLAFLPIIPIFLIFTLAKKYVIIKKIAPIFIVYSCILGLMLVSGINYYLSEGGVKGIVIISASVLFATSDSCLVIRDYGIFNIVKKPLKVFVLVTYYVAQVLFGLSIVL